jgi:TetR/AcrR family transcriptional regulator
MVKDKNTEQTIFDAARKVFQKKGLDGARMQEIADEAGMNKALLHYYFRTKEKLFEGIFNESIGKISLGIQNVFNEKMTVIEKLEALVSIYVDTLSENRYLPLFVLNEMNQHPEKFEAVFNKFIVVHLKGFLLQVEKEARSGMIKPVNPLHLLMNVLGMIIFPFAAYPVVSLIINKNMDSSVEDFFEARKKEVYDFIEKALDPKK